MILGYFRSRILNMMKTSQIKFFLITVVLLSTSRLWAWGGRGHDTICEVAVHLVEDPSLKNFLQGRGYMMGHLCNIPDTQWRQLDAKAKAAGDPTHFIDPEIVGAIPKTLSLDLASLIKEHSQKPNQFEKGKKIFSVPREVGTSWWRVDQFMREIAALKEKFQTAKPPQSKQEEQNDEHPFNQAAHRFITMAGVMGHFVGDASQPLHSTADYDGYAQGHGGLHGYYETAVVNTFDGDLQTQVLKEARKIKKAPWLQGSTLEKMRTFSQVAFEDLPQVWKLDPVLKKSERKEEKGMSLRTPAERKPPEEAAKKYKPLIIKQMARSAKLLANLWDEAYKNAGKPNLNTYKSYKYPHTVDFLYPDYE